MADEKKTTSYRIFSVETSTEGEVWTTFKHEEEAGSAPAAIKAASKDVPEGTYEFVAVPESNITRLPFTRRATTETLFGDAAEPQVKEMAGSGEIAQ